MSTEASSTKASLDERLRAAPGKVCLYLFLGAAAVRVLYLSQYAGAPLFWVPALDSLYHDLLARGIAAGKPPVGPYFRAPLYYYWLAGVYALFGHSFWAARLIQALVGSASCVLLYLLGGRLFRPSVALLAAGAMALYGPLVFFDGELLTPVLEVFLGLLFLLLFQKSLEDGSPRTAGLSGLAIGLAAITRPNILVVLPLAVVWLWSAGGRSRARSTALLVAGSLLAPAAVTLRNYAVARDPVFIASQGGINLFLGNRPEADGFTPSTPKRFEFAGEYEDSVALFGQRAAEEAAGHPLSASEAQRHWIREVLRWWGSDPGGALRLTWKKWVLAWGHREIRNNHAFDFVRSEFAPLLWLAPAGFWVAGPLGLLGMVVAWRDHRRARFLVLFVLVYVASFVLFFVADRYRLPVVPPLLLFAAYALSWGWERLQSRDRRALAGWAAGLAAFGLFVGVDWYRTATPATLALDYWSTGNRYKDLGRLPEAESFYRKALTLDPANADVWTNLGVVQFGGERTAEALASFEQALQLDPENAGTHLNAAVCALKLGRPKVARPHLESARRLAPDNPKVQELLKGM